MEFINHEYELDYRPEGHGLRVRSCFLTFWEEEPEKAGIKTHGLRRKLLAWRYHGD